MDINFRLFSERLRRVSAGEEVTLPDVAKQPIQNLLAENEIITSCLKDFEYETSWLLVQKIGKEEIDDPDLGNIIDEINCFTYESEKMQQLKRTDSEIIDAIKTFEAEASISSSSKSRDTVGLDDKMEELLDLLIEGPTQLSVVAILDSIGLDKTAFAGEAYNSSYVKHYFDCHAWIPGPYSYDADQILDIVIKFLMPSSSIRMWDTIREILSDNQNGSRVIITLTDLKIITSFQFEYGENIRLDIMPTGEPLRATYKGWPFLILYHGIISLEENIGEAMEKPLGLWYFKYCRLPFCLKLCFLYLSVFPAHLEISTRQLYQLWIAEGFIPDNSEATAEKDLELLINRGFVDTRKRGAGGTINTCSVHGRCRPVLLSVAFEAKFVFFPFGDPKGRKLTCGSDGFPNLKVLHLKSMLWLEEWTMGIGAMPKLECLIINPCAYLKKMPEQPWCIKSLNKFNCWWPQLELRQKLREFEDKEQYGIQLYPYGI
ncbi:NB-ARC domain-containing protein [Citrus sinensis]|uniref:NB-ARC domain-containing protein n=1 Tax=Citrus sinensis TaxID=2711 RepID=A0ACB8I0S5_CITSI|nr:NB-ARC domain-containing protein [Citrus sinensis]